ncbi:sodium/glutamate symporter [Planctomycetes bacterium K23_9]|uniref:Sodium/glutamate symporter n=1 Tax=Stieleria marina TaxID=1930275 RepID=A0A517NNB7_9BACT|nr:Sodium/glutamate symporter [Planctomycetes bacterium K23_9]
MTLAFLFVAVVLLIGVLLRTCVPLLRWLFIPASVVAGFVGLAVIQTGKSTAPSSGWPAAASSVSDSLSQWPGWLIAVVFAGMLLNQGRSIAKENLSRVGRQGLMVWIIVLGETAIGLVATWLFVQPFYDVPNSFGMLIETGFAGGHGTAAAMGEVFLHPSIGLESGKDLGMLMATCGLVGGLLSGIVAINIGARLGWIHKTDEPFDRAAESQKLELPIGIARIERETIDPLLFQVIWLALAFGVGLLLQDGVTRLAEFVDTEMGWGGTAKSNADAAQGQLAKRLSASSVAIFPLFIYTLFGGWIIQRILRLLGQSHRIDGETLNRLTSTAMDVLVVAAIASLNLEAVAALLVPFLILMVGGLIWATVCLLMFARWILPREHWFQLGLINYGMSTGTTATGFVLLRMVDPELKSGAAEDYALAAPLSAPFIGGGMITIALPLLVLQRVWIGAAALVLVAVVVALILAGRSWNQSTQTAN